MILNPQHNSLNLCDYQGTLTCEFHNVTPQDNPASLSIQNSGSFYIGEIEPDTVFVRLQMLFQTSLLWFNLNRSNRTDLFSMGSVCLLSFILQW